MPRFTKRNLTICHKSRLLSIIFRNYLTTCVFTSSLCPLSSRLPQIHQVQNVIIPMHRKQTTTYPAALARNTARVARLTMSVFPMATALVQPATLCDPAVPTVNGIVHSCPYFCTEGNDSHSSWKGPRHKLPLFSPASLGLNRRWFSIVNVSGDMNLNPVGYDANRQVIFCCGNGYNETAGNCTKQTKRLGHMPFRIGPTKVIFNRTTRSTILPDAIPAQISTIMVRAPLFKREIAVGLGVGIPLLITTLAALEMFRSERRLRLKFAKGPPPESELRDPPPRRVLVSMGTSKIYEFDGVPIVKELPDSYIREVGENGFEVI